MKYIILIGDGMADEPQKELGGQTPLQVAVSPNMDFLASHGRLGLIRTVPPGLPPGSDVANLSVFGYSPEHYYTGRAPLEAASMGIHLDEDDIAFRCNLVFLERHSDADLMGDYSGGAIPTAEAKQIIAELQRSLSDGGLEFHPGVSYRHIVVCRKSRERFRGLKTTPPHDITGRPVTDFLPHGPGADFLRDAMEEARRIIRGLVISRPGLLVKGRANAIWLWGEGRAPRMPTITERYGLKGTTICAVDLIRGIGRLAGFEPTHVPGATGDLDTDYAAKAVAALNALELYDLALIHVEAPDEASHRGMLEEKIRAIEDFDRLTVGTVLKGVTRFGGYRILLLPDHPTPLRTKTHSSDPVPFVLFDAELGKGPGSSRFGFDENSATGSGYLVQEGWRIMEHLIRGVLPDFSL